MELGNVAAERAVLSGICNFGKEAYLDVEYLLEEETFTVDHNKVLYKCLTNIISKVEKVDFVGILSSAHDLGLEEYVNKQEILKHIQGVMNTPVDLSNVRDYAKKLRRLQYARQIQKCIKDSYQALEQITGDEPLAQIVSLVEEPLTTLSLSYVRQDDTKPKLISEGLKEYIQDILDGKVKKVGISSGLPSYDESIGGGFLRGGIDLIGARPKALCYGSKVYTPFGPKKIENLNVGDVISHPFNGTTEVLEIYDFNNIDIYRIHFRDGDYVDCCEDHLWEVHKRNYQKKEKFVKSTKELINDLIIRSRKGQNEYKWDVKLPDPLYFEEKDLPIDPYILGVLLGDGSLIKTCVYTSMDDEIIESVNNYFSNLGYTIKLEERGKGKKCVTYRVNGFQDKLREVGCFKCNCYNKYIPKDYIYNSIENRLFMLQGLLDTDGCCVKDKNSSRIKFTSVSKRLALDVKEIVESLGGICSLRPQITKCRNIPFKSFRCEIRLPFKFAPFRLKRKLDVHSPRMIGELKRTIVKIEQIDKNNARCIKTSNEDGLFLTDNCIITHNCGKSIFADNAALFVSNLGIPVLMLDTEMRADDHWNRILANISGVKINDIKLGKITSSPEKMQKVREAYDHISKIPYHYKNITGKPFSEVISIARRWIFKEVGFQSNGRTNDCLIIYDYLKLTSSDSVSASVQEYQALGFQMVDLHNFVVEYDVPCLSFVQLNRDGATKESSDVISQSDRIGWVCTSFTILKEKSEEEKVDDGIKNGNRKLVPVLSRHGPGIEDNGYICLQMDGDVARMKELGTIRQLKKNKDLPQLGTDKGESKPANF